MTNGLKTMILNSQERILSVDANRLQAFAAAGLLDILREWLLANNGLATGTPLAAEILNGLYVKPINGSFQLSVAAGSMVCIETPGADEDSLHYAHLAADYVNPAFALTANVSGQIRWDFIECQRLSQVVETDSRDIFNVSTGLFTAATVDKAVASTVAFRIRTGTPGAGLLAPDTGWLPIAAVLVPSGAANNDACDFYDIRPMLRDRVLQYQEGDLPKQLTAWANSSESVNADGVLSTQGESRWVFKGRQVGGMIRSGAPGVLKRYMSNTTDVSNGWAPAGNSLVNLYLCFPGGFPRWSRYTDAATGTRNPDQTCGIFVWSQTEVNEQFLPNASVPLPASMGLTASQTEAVSTGITSFYISFLSTVADFSYDGQRITFTALGTSSIFKNTVSSFTLTDTFLPSVDFPRTAKAIGCLFDMSWGTAQIYANGFAVNIAIGKMLDPSVNFSFEYTGLNSNLWSIPSSPQAVIVKNDTVTGEYGTISKSFDLPLLHPAPYDAFPASIKFVAGSAPIPGWFYLSTGTSTAPVGTLPIPYLKMTIASWVVN